MLESRNPLSLVIFAVTATVLAPLYEELVFRGVLLPALVTRFGAVAGVAITSALFAVAHLSLVEFAPLFVLGIVLCWLRLKSGGLSRSRAHAFRLERLHVRQSHPAGPLIIVWCALPRGL